MYNNNKKKNYNFIVELQHVVSLKDNIIITIIIVIIIITISPWTCKTLFHQDIKQYYYYINNINYYY